jgi:hypothetical protein
MAERIRERLFVYLLFSSVFIGGLLPIPKKAAALKRGAGRTP